MNFFKMLLTSSVVFASLAWSQVNINTATIDELSALSGIGEKKARAIINYRKENGAFKTVSELVNVKGIGEKTVENLADDIILKGKTNLENLSKSPSKKNKAQPLKTKKKEAVKSEVKTQADQSDSIADTKKSTKSSTVKSTKSKNSNKPSKANTQNKTKKQKAKKADSKPKRSKAKSAE